VILSEYITLSKQYGAGYSRTQVVNGTLEAVAKEASRAAETERIRSALKETKGNKSRAAEILKVSYKTLLTKIKEYGIES
jgi:transcriptional regulator with PAS, ATPase and Fis domain